MHSDSYRKIRLWFNLGFWNEVKVHNAVFLGQITTEEFKEITGKDYE